MSRLPTISLRVAATFVGLAGILYGPAWLPLVVITLLSLRYRAWEALILGMCMDLMWMQSAALLPSMPLFTLVSLVIVWGLEPLRAELMLA